MLQKIKPTAYKDGLLEYDARTITLKNIGLSKEWKI